MASLALTQAHSLFRAPALRFSFSYFLPAALLAPKPFTWALPSLQSLLDLFPPFVLAVPKKKTSHSRKAMRSANKGLKDKRNIVHCPGCGHPKLAHHLCSNCYSSLSRGWKAQAKQGQSDVGPDS